MLVLQNGSRLLNYIFEQMKSINEGWIFIRYIPIIISMDNFVFPSEYSMQLLGIPLMKPILFGFNSSTKMKEYFFSIFVQ